ncbi:hypothetical protein M404DRAFT_75396, partial [Pisolithus tinctorius Marx 270]
LGRLPLPTGTPVIITENLRIAGKVANGAHGTVWDIVCSAVNGKHVLRCVYVSEPASTLQLPGEDAHIVAIFPQTCSFPYIS